ncbi:hypothetical protein RHMOL_Rhmol12G0029300 [Rhododendron molle]|uniref:Uncharacterized protein n=1 Tax=Rhododendron molle TaxID=49168 RepID=A0ACC0LDX6_RHOML|nr:hypothetical protein RHMOL_Rhmol12G0029300 [Rhododendron molle]
MARLMRRRRLMIQRNDPLMNQRFLEIEREARRLGSAYLRLRRLRRAPSLLRNDRNSLNAHVIPIGGQFVNIPLPTSNEPNPTEATMENLNGDKPTDQNIMLPVGHPNIRMSHRKIVFQLWENCQHESAMTDEVIDVQQISTSQSTRVVKIGIYCSKWMFSVRANTIDLRNLIEEYLVFNPFYARAKLTRSSVVPVRTYFY